MSAARALEGEAPVLSREQARSRRKRAVRGATISVKRLTQISLAVGRALYPDEGIERPRTRADCVDGPRPCPWVACRYHLALDVLPETGGIKVNFPDLEPHEMPAAACCALDVADRGEATLEQVGVLMNLTRERVRQVQAGAMRQLADPALRQHLDRADETPPSDGPPGDLP